MRLDEWIERYRRAWEEADVEAVGELFTDDAAYRSNPSPSPTAAGRRFASIGGRRRAPSRGVEVAMGRPVVDGRRAVVEWWT